MKTKNILLTLFIIYHTIIGFSQGDPNDAVGRVAPTIPPLPNAAALHKFAEVPVNNFSGIPDISVSLYELKGKDLSVPVSLNYHLGNVKVNQPASNVGLGWALNAGGSVSRTVHGLPDELDMGYVKLTSEYDYETNLPTYGVSVSDFDLSYNSATVPMPDGSYMKQFSVRNNLESHHDFIARDDKYWNFRYTYDINKKVNTWSMAQNYPFHEKLARAAYGKDDLLPDAFSLVLPDGRTAQFVFNKNKEVVLINQQDLSITTNLFEDPVNAANVWWEVKDGAGVTYHFEGIHEYSNYQQGQETVLSGNPYENFPSTWHLTSITSPSGSQFTFNYVRDVFDDYELPFTQTVETLISRRNIYNAQCNLNSNGYSASYRRNIVAWRIDRITCLDNGSNIKFNYDTENPRTDIGSKYRLMSVALYNGDNEISSYELHHSYQNRLQLNKIEQVVKKGDQYNRMDFRSFSYNNTLSFPSSLRTAFDHWGFYNGKSASSNLPNMWHTRVDDTTSNAIKFATIWKIEDNHREPDEVFMKVGVLQNIIYPTGGKTNFVYEPHYYATEEKDYNEIQLAGVIGIDHETRTSITFHIDPEQFPPHMTTRIKDNSPELYSFVKIVANLKWDPQGDNPAPNDLGSHFVGLRHIESGEVWAPQAGDLYEDGQQGLDPSKPFYLLLKEGTYEAIAGGILSDNPGNRASIKVFAQQEKEVSSYKKMAGGLRIKEINYLEDGLNKVKNKKFSYTNPQEENRCSGLLLDQYMYESLPFRTYVWDPQIAVPGEMYIYEELKEQIHRLSSESRIPHQGFHICYSDVLVSETGNGTVHYKYSTERDIEPFMTLGSKVTYLNGWKKADWLFIKPISKATYRGKLLSEFYLNESGDSILSNKYYHSFINKKEVPVYNTDLWLRRLNPETDEVGILLPNYVTVRFAKTYIESVFPQLDSVVTTNYYGSEKLISKKSFSYNLKNYQQKGSTSKIGREQISSTTYYTCDYDGSTENIETLVDQHIISLPVKSIQLRISAIGGLPEHGGEKPIIQRSVTASFVKYTDFGKPLETFISKMGEDISISLDPNSLGDENKFYLKAKYTYNTNNLLHFTDILSNKTYYHYGYNNSYPVAKIDGVELSDVNNATSYLNQLDDEGIDLKSVNNNIRKNLPDSAMVNTYTFEPLVGIKTQTDANGITTYYDYDDFNRLKYIKDNNQNILKHYKYVLQGSQIAPVLNLGAVTYQTVELSWAALEGASKYYVYRSTNNEDFTKIGESTAATYIDVQVSPSTIYYYKIKSVKDNVASSYSNSVTATTMMEPPGIPVISSIICTDENTVKLSWSGADRAIKYGIMKGTSEANLVLLHTPALNNQLEFEDIDATQASLLYYKVVAYNAENTSNTSEVANILTRPTQPVIRSVTADSETQITINWLSLVGVLDGFKIYKDSDAPITVTANVSTYSFTGLTANTSYSFKIKSFNSAGESDFSTVVTGETQNGPPGTPSITSITSPSSSQITLVWTNVSNETGYKVFRGTSSSNVTQQVADLTAGTTTYTNASGLLNSGTTYYYKVLAYNENHTRTSAVASRITQPATPSPINGPSELCMLTLKSFTYSVAQVTGASSYTWEVPSGWIIESGQNTSIISVKSSRTMGDVKVRANNASGSSNFRVKTIGLKPNPATPGSVFGATFVTPGTTYEYSVGAVQNADSYSWFVPSGATIISGQGSTTIQVVFPSNMSTSATVSVRAVGCSFSGASSIKVYKSI